MPSEWYDDLLGECLCWDNATADWCSSLRDQCEDFIIEASGPSWYGLMWGMTIVVGTVMHFTVFAMSSYLSKKLEKVSGKKTPTYLQTLRTRGFYCTRALGLFAVVVTLVLGTVDNVYGNDFYFELRRVNNTITTSTQAIRGSGVLFQSAADVLYRELEVVPPTNVQSTTTRWMDMTNRKQAYVSEHISEYLLPAVIWPAVCWGFVSWIITLHRKPAITRVMFAIAAVGSVPLTLLQAVTVFFTYLNIIGCTDYLNLKDFGMDVLSSKFSNESQSIYSFYDTCLDEMDYYYCESDESPLIDALEYFAITLPDCHGYESIKRIIESESRLRIGSPGRGDCTGACSITSCAELCLENSAERNVSIDVTSQWKTISNSLGVVETFGFPLAELTPYSNLMTSLHTPLCSPLLEQNIYIVCWTTIILFFYTLVIVYLCYSSTHIPPRSHSAYYGPHDEHFERVSDPNEGYITDEDIMLQSIDGPTYGGVGRTEAAKERQPATTT